MANDDNRNTLALRIMVEDADPIALDDLRRRVEAAGLTVDAQSRRAIDAHGPVNLIEQALEAKVEDRGNGPQFVDQPKLRVGPNGNSIQAYFPRKPSFF